MFNLDQGRIERIDADSRRILREIGVRLDDAALRNAALKAGARPGHAGGFIRIPDEMVTEHLALAPSDAVFADGTGKLTRLGQGCPPTFWTGAALNRVDDRQCRPITSETLADFIRVADSLDTVFAVVGTSVADVPPPVRDVVGLRIMAVNSGKHLRPLLFTPAHVPAMLDMARVVAGGASLRSVPVISFGYSCLSPLHWSTPSTDLWRLSSGHNIPLMLNAEPIMGGTSPVTAAGALSLANAEILAGIVLVQLLEPGRPVVHNLGFAHAIDMRTGTCLAGSAECALLSHSGGRIAAYYGIPCASWMGTDAMIDDEQASMEKLLTAFAHVTSDVSLIWGMGQLESEKSISPVQLLIDHELASAALRYHRGFEVSEETLAYRVIEEVVTRGGDFLSHEHTLEHFREELSESKLLVRTNRDRWTAAGAKELAQSAAEKLDALRNSERPAHLSDDQQRELERIEKTVFRRESGSKH